MHRYLSLLLLIGLAWGQGVCQYDNYNLTFTGQTKSENGKFTKQYRCANNHYYWIIASKGSGYKGSVYQGGRGIAFQGKKGNSENSNDAKLKKEELKQNERIALAKMTPEQRKYYLKMKEEEKRRNQIRNQESTTCLTQIFIGVAIYGLLYEINRVGLKRALSF